MGIEYSLPESLRPVLARPLGRMFTTDEVTGAEFFELVRTAPMLITVGDRVTETVGKAGRVPDVQVVDGRENRRDRMLPEVQFSRLVRVSNPAGTITQEAIEGLKEAFTGSKPVRVLVAGEEDLLAILAIALAPLSALLLYGQPHEGIVAVKVGSDTKSRNRALLETIGIPELR
ncbi:MAG: DUF359 domain-containing protein [Thaumarchaeota archaeon]|nr:DUF359 domain-containing protein [Nitrososphaerota archaeon]